MQKSLNESYAEKDNVTKNSPREKTCRTDPAAAAKQNLSSRSMCLPVIVTSLFIIFTVVMCCILVSALPFKPRGNIIGARYVYNYTGSDNNSILMPYFNITGFRGINTFLFVQKNNATDIQRVIDSCPSRGCTIYLQEGDYNINNKINITGDNIEIIFNRGARLVGNLSENVFFATSQRKNFVLRNANLLQTQTPLIGTAINLSHFIYSLVENPTIKGFNQGITFDHGTYYNTIQDPYIDNCTTGISIGKNANNLIGGRIYPVDDPHSVGLQISGQGNSIYGTSIERVGGKANGTGIVMSGNYNLISGVYLEALKYGINVSGALNTIISVAFSTGMDVEITETNSRNTWIGIRNTSNLYNYFEDVIIADGKLNTSLNANNYDITNAKDIYATNLYNLGGVNGRSTGSMNIQGGTTSQDILIKTRNSSGSAINRIQIKGGDGNTDIDILNSNLDLNDNGMDNFYFVNPPAACPGGQHISFFNGSHSICD